MNPWLLAGAAAVAIGAVFFNAEKNASVNVAGGAAPDIAATVSVSGAAGPSRDRAAGSVVGERAAFSGTYMPFNPNIQISPRVRASRSQDNPGGGAASIFGVTASPGATDWLSTFVAGLNNFFTGAGAGFTPAPVTTPAYDPSTGPYIPGYTPLNDSNVPIPRTSDERIAVVVPTVGGNGTIPQVNLRPGDFGGFSVAGFGGGGFDYAFLEDTARGLNGPVAFPEYNPYAGAVRDVDRN